MEPTDIEKNNLKEDCDKMISALETVYSVAFLITFIALCVVVVFHLVTIVSRN